MAGGSEDCLFLNVYTPSLKGKRAVMFWIHGGAFMSGNGDTSLYGPQHLIKEDVVVVTINHRYSALGFLSTSDRNAPGNQGMKDAVMALKWVQQNIEKFGGDRKRVTIFGHSAGSVAVHFLMLSDMAKGLFHQAILQSGSALMSCLYQPDPRTSAENLGRKLGLTFNSSEELIEKLRQVDIKDLIDAETPLFAMGTPWGLRPFEFSPVVEPVDSLEERFLSESPETIMQGKRYRKMAMMIGSPTLEGMFVSLLLQNSDILNAYNQNPDFIVPLSFNLQKESQEMSEAIQTLRNLYFGGRPQGTLVEWLKVYSDGIFRYPADRVIRDYAETSDHPIFYYYFAFDGSLNFFKKMFNFHYDGVCHADELFYLFETELPGFVPDVNSTLVRKRMTRLWSNFAKFGYGNHYL